MRTAIVAVVLTIGIPVGAAAQTVPLPASEPIARTQAEPAGEPGVSFGSVFSSLGRELKQLPSKETAIILGLGGALALAVHPADRTLTRSASGSEFLDRTFEAGGVTGGGWVQAGAALGTFVVGRVSDNRRVQAVGVDLMQAQLVTSVLTHGIKLAVNRSRPDAGRYSFPSGHASTTFANATVLYRHFGWKVGVPAYAVASYVGVSRLQENRHYASDVIFGAALGIVAGRRVTVGHGSARFAVSPMALRGGGGVTFTRVP